MKAIYEFANNCINKLSQGDKAAITSGAKTIIVYHDTKIKDLFNIHTYNNGKAIDSTIGICKSDLEQKITNIIKHKEQL